jgi:hypothetical protein
MDAMGTNGELTNIIKQRNKLFIKIIWSRKNPNIIVEQRIRPIAVVHKISKTYFSM